MSIFDKFEASVRGDLPRHSSVKKPLSPEMTRLLVLVMYDGYELFPRRENRDAGADGR